MSVYIRTYPTSVTIINEYGEGPDMMVVPIDRAPKLYAICDGWRAGNKGSITKFDDGTWCYRQRDFAWPHKKVTWKSLGLKVKSEA